MGWLTSLFKHGLNSPWLSMKSGDSVIAKITGSSLTGAEREANAFSAQQAELNRSFQANEAEKARQWEQQMSDTSYQRQVADLQAAGLNPAMAMGGSASGASTPSSPSPSGSSASSVTPDSGSSLSDILQLISFKKDLDMKNAQIGNIKADTENKEADTENIQSRTSLLGPEFDQKVRGMDLEERKVYLQEVSTEISRDLTDAEISKMEVEKDSLRQHIEESKQNVRESVSRIAVNAAQEALYGAEAYQIYELLPYVKLLKDAQTQTEWKQAAYLGVQTAYQNGLIDKGYIDQMVRKVAAEADIDVYGAQSAAVNAYLDKLHMAMRKGEYLDIEDGNIFQRDLAKIGNGVLRGFSTFCDQFKPLTTIGSASIISSNRK